MSFCDYKAGDCCLGEEDEEDVAPHEADEEFIVDEVEDGDDTEGEDVVQTIITRTKRVSEPFPYFSLVHELHSCRRSPVGRKRLKP